MSFTSTWLFSTAARSFNFVSADGAHFELLSQPVNDSVSWSSDTPGNSRFISAAPCADISGINAFSVMAIFACMEMISRASPCRAALIILRAARTALIDVSGVASINENQVYSSRCRPLNSALTGEPPIKSFT